MNLKPYEAKQNYIHSIGTIYTITERINKMLTPVIEDKREGWFYYEIDHLSIVPGEIGDYYRALIIYHKVYLADPVM